MSDFILFQRLAIKKGKRVMAWKDFGGKRRVWMSIGNILLLLVVSVGKHSVADSKFHDLPTVDGVALSVGGGVPVVWHGLHKVEYNICELIQFTLPLADNTPLTDLTIAVDHESQTDAKEAVFCTLIGERIVEEPAAECGLVTLVGRVILWVFEVANCLGKLLVVNRIDCLRIAW